MGIGNYQSGNIPEVSVIKEYVAEVPPRGQNSYSDSVIVTITNYTFEHK